MQNGRVKRKWIKVSLVLFFFKAANKLKTKPINIVKFKSVLK